MDVLQKWLEELDTLLASGDRGAAECYLQDRLSQLEEEGSTHSGAYITLLNELGSFYRGISRFEESSQMFKRALEALKLAGLSFSIPYVTTYLNLAGCHRLMGNTETAVSEYVEIQEVLKGLSSDTALSEEERIRLAYIKTSTLNNIALLYCDLEKWELALDSAEQAAKLVFGGAGGEHEAATTYNNLANIYSRMGRVSDADEACHKALEIFDNMPNKNVHHAAALSTFAALRYQEGDYDKAEAALEQALELTEYFFGKNIEYTSAAQSLEQVRAAKKGKVE